MHYDGTLNARMECCRDPKDDTVARQRRETKDDVLNGEIQDSMQVAVEDSPET